MSYFSEAKKPVAAKNTVRTRPSAAVSSSALTHEQISDRARKIWQAKGCPQGQDEANWKEAEAQLKKELHLQ